MTISANVAALRQEYVRATSRERWGEAAAVAVLLGFEPIAGHRRFARHVSHDGIDWDDLLTREKWTPSERLLIGTAAGLWRGRRTDVDISQVAYLDDDFLATWLAIIRAGTTGHVTDGSPS
jgi:hypothetical protein